MAYRRILTIQDISCVGQCSMTVALPILSVCGHETCILPTALLSTHTGGFGKPVVRHLADGMDDIRDHWLRAGIHFDCILTGYLGSVEAILAAESMVDSLLTTGGKLIVDPAMADHGRLYSGLDEAYAEKMKKLCLRADVMMPNLTEAAMMAGMPLPESSDEAAVRVLLGSLGGQNVVLTGVSLAEGMTGAAVRRDGAVSFYQHPRVAQNYHGTGDIFAACFTGAWMQEKSMEEAVRIAADVTFRCIENTARNPAHWYGVKFETALPYLARRLNLE